MSENDNIETQNSEQMPEDDNGDPENSEQVSESPEAGELEAELAKTKDQLLRTIAAVSYTHLTLPTKA